jgi:Na+-transporting NADH:ubiquinone oxidoreductase subunit F
MDLVLLSVGIFTAVILLLVLMLMLAQAKLMPAGDVKMKINGDDKLTKTLKPGGTLLNALADNKIFLPSACGGGGTCAMCKCQVVDGGGDLLPTEAGHITRKEAAENWRLACQVKVKNDIEIKVPDEIFNIKKFHCKVRSNDNQATFIKELVLEIQNGETLDFQAGGYIQIDIPKYQNLSFKNFDIEEQYRGDWDQFKLWDLVGNNPEDCFRAYSMANHPAEGNIVMLNVRIATPPPGRYGDIPPGIASTYIFNLKPGDDVIVSGPYGEFFVQDTDREMMFIGGGAGMAPMRSHIFNQFHTNKTSRKATFWYGARSKREMFYDDHFKKIAEEFPNFSYNVALSEPEEEDNWEGYTGFIHDVILENYLKNHPAPEDIEYYMCGPPIMNKCVKDMLYNLGVEKDMIHLDEF